MPIGGKSVSTKDSSLVKGRGGEEKGGTEEEVRERETRDGPRRRRGEGKEG